MKDTVALFLSCLIAGGLSLDAFSAPPPGGAAETDARLHSDGKGWRLDRAKISDPKRPRVLLIGDSILSGYQKQVIQALDGAAYVDTWVNPHHQSDHLNKLLVQVLENGPYDVVHFNMGLHGWQEGRIEPATFKPLTGAYVQVLRDKLPRAKLIWASSTPVTTTEKPFSLEPEIDPVIVRHNRMAAEVMAEKKVPVNDFYSLLADRLDLARGDRFHWQAPAYEILAKAVTESVLRELPKITEAPPLPDRPPWAGSYKIRPEETDRLTEADFVGPDGIVYPDWTWAGVPGGIPAAPIKVKAEDFGAIPDDEGDDSAAIQKAVDALARQGGGALSIGAGTFQLDRPILVESDGIVIRGAGPAKTKLIFRYQDGPTEKNRVHFFSPAPLSTVNRNTLIEIHCHSEDLMRMQIYLDDKLIGERVRSAHWGNTFSLSTSGGSAGKLVKDGVHTLRGLAEYRDGSKHDAEIEVTVDSQSREPQRKPESAAAISFRGKGKSGQEILLAEDGKRGSREISLAGDHDFAAGDFLYLRAPATERWKKLTQNACAWGTYRACYFVVEKVEGRKIVLNQPMRIEYPVIDGAYVQKWNPLRRCGAEDFYLEHTAPYWITGVGGRDTAECWARNLHVHKAGRHAIMFTESKWCEIRDCIHDESWFNGGGGTAYVGWQHDSDCLMDGCKAIRMRHGPCVQWAAVGNVIRNSEFSMSDGQWHAGWSTENLFENCVIDARQGDGSYGYGFWASPPNDTAHGPEGPRNVIYNCDARSPKGSLWMGGMNENWIVVYNRLASKSGPGVYAQRASFDHIIRGNVFLLENQKSPVLELKDKDCIGVEITENRIFGGSGALATGKAEPAVAEGNTFEPFAEAPRPQPAAPSIFEWQRQHKK